MKLELKHLAPYLPYGLKILSGKVTIREMDTVTSFDNKRVSILSVISGIGHKPLLIPISEIQSEKYINIFFQKDSFLDEVTNSDNQFESAFNFVGRFKITDNDYCYPYDFFTKLFELHFDVFGLIEAGLALNKLYFIK